MAVLGKLTEEDFHGMGVEPIAIDWGRWGSKIAQGRSDLRVLKSASSATCADCGQLHAMILVNRQQLRVDSCSGHFRTRSRSARTSAN